MRENDAEVEYRRAHGEPDCPDTNWRNYDDLHLAPCIKNFPITNPQDNPTNEGASPMSTETTPKPAATKPAAKKTTRKTAAKKTTAKTASKPAAKPAKKSEPRKRVNAAASTESNPVGKISNATKKLIKDHLSEIKWPSKIRKTGTTVGLFDNRTGQFDSTSDTKWFVACVDHGTLLGAKSSNEGSDWRGHSDRWCGACQGVAAEKAAAATAKPAAAKPAAKSKPAAKTASKPIAAAKRSRAKKADETIAAELTGNAVLAAAVDAAEKSA